MIAGRTLLSFAYYHAVNYSRTSEAQLARKGDEKAIAKLNESAKLVVVSSEKENKNKSKAGAVQAEAEIGGEVDDFDDIDSLLEAEAAKDEATAEENKVGLPRKRGRPGKSNTQAPAALEPYRKQKVYKDAYQLQLHRRVMHIADLVDLDDDPSAEDLFAKKLEIPFILKKHLVEEWGLVTQDPKVTIICIRRYHIVSFPYIYHFSILCRGC